MGSISSNNNKKGRGMAKVLKDGEVVNTTTGEIVTVNSIPAVDSMTSDEYAAWLKSESITVETFDGGSEWDLIGNKDSLIDQDMVIARIRFNETETGSFVSVCAYTNKGDKIVFNDGGTGVYQQLENYVRRTGRTTAIRCPKGLRVSRYKYIDKHGVERPAATYYIA